MPNCEALKKEHKEAIKVLRREETELARLMAELADLKRQASPDWEKIRQAQQAVDSVSDQLNTTSNDVDEIANELHRCEQGHPATDPF
ncbi:hypothetical protein [Kitasatospora phosalacinea]|uniref:hypothetical protein n=1 Tax=Kitasatospora phosalacinea TaxID=2065 RepID=UPI001428C395|nr:hypothetical protein [Kitasatospora phosalacinea]